MFYRATLCVRARSLLSPGVQPSICLSVSHVGALYPHERESSSAIGHSRSPAQKRGTACQSTSGHLTPSLPSRTVSKHICLNCRTASSSVVLTLIGALVVTHAMLWRLTSWRCIIIIIIWGWKIAPVMYINRPRRNVTLSIWFWVFKYFIQYYYKLLCVLVVRCLNGAAPQYLSELIQPLSDVDSRRRLRSASTAEVLVPATWRSTIGDHAFAIASPRSWNSLPVDMCLSRTFITFKTHVKSHLFNLSFPSVWLYQWLFLYTALEAACAAYASLNLSLLDYITLLPASNITVMCKKSGALNFMWPNETFM